MKIGYIYKIENIKGNIYIGQTFYPIKRKSRYKTLQCKGQYHIYNSIKCYGWENHSWEIIEVINNCDQNLLNEREIYWIKFYDSFINGMNLQPGGRYKPKTKETKQRMSESRIGKKASEETKKKMSESHKKRLFENPYGKEHYLKIGSYQKKKIEAYFFYTNEFIGIFDSIKECCAYLNISNKHISGVLKGNRKRVSKYSFKEIK